MHLVARMRRLPRTSLAIAAIVLVMGTSTAAIGVDAVIRAHLDDTTLVAPRSTLGSTFSLRGAG
jgi:hypothetical protein